MPVALAVAALTTLTGPTSEDDWLERWTEQARYGLTVELVDDYREETWVTMLHGPAVTYPVVRGSYTVGSWESLIIIYFDEADWDWARRVMHCESRGDPDATNPSSGAAGLFQFLPSTWEWSKPWPGASPYNPTANVMAAAAWLLDEYGPSQWSCQ